MIGGVTKTSAGTHTTVNTSATKVVSLVNIFSNLYTARIAQQVRTTKLNIQLLLASENGKLQIKTTAKMRD